MTYSYPRDEKGRGAENGRQAPALLMILELNTNPDVIALVLIAIVRAIQRAEAIADAPYL